MSEQPQLPPGMRLLPSWARSTHPVYRREMERWARARGLTRMRTGCAPLAFAVFAGLACLCGLTIQDPSLEPEQRLLVWSLIVLWGLLVGQAFVSFATGLIATALSATTISGEIEDQTYGLLRVTGVSTDEIILAKFAATLRQLVIPVGVIVAARVLLVLGGLVTLDYALRLQGIEGGLIGVLGELPPELINPLGLSIALLSILVWVGFFIGMPLLSTVLFTSVGLLASSTARTRVNGIITAVGLRVVLYVLRAISDQALTVFGQLSVNYGINTTNLTTLLETLVVTRPALLIGLGSLVLLGGLLVAILWRGAVTYLLVRASVRRAYKLPYE